ncbi:O-antigen translocase [Buttiauxella sp. B2]|uniref:O-antigen translocase n=1 Tax=Buttiauxella sp. B2 TaxID=2587812 RepID=UPI0026D2C8F9
MTGLLTLVKMVMGFVIAKVVAVYTGPSGMALLGQVQSLVNGFNGVINSPVNNGIIRYTSENKEYGFNACSPWWKASFQWVMLLCLIMIPLGLIFSESISEWIFGNADYKWIVSAVIICLPFTAIGTLITSVINGQQLYRRYVALGMASAIISGLLMIVMIIYADLNGALLAATIQSAIVGIILLLSSLRQPWIRLKYWWGRTGNKERKDIGGYILMAMATALTLPISLILIRNILVDHVGWIVTGQWQAVWKISEVYLGVITMALGVYFLPRLSTIDSATEIKNEINNTAIVIIPIVTLLAVLVYLTRDIAISILFTKEFSPARDLFFIQLLGDVVKVASWLYAYPMLSRKATKWFVGTEVIFSISWVVFTLIFVSKIGVHGANYAYLFNYILYFLFVFCNVKRFSR